MRELRANRLESERRQCRKSLPSLQTCVRASRRTLFKLTLERVNNARTVKKIARTLSKRSQDTYFACLVHVQHKFKKFMSFNAEILKLLVETLRYMEFEGLETCREIICDQTPEPVFQKAKLLSTVCLACTSKISI